jgi:uncharacterized protein (TIGR03086 family)
MTSLASTTVKARGEKAMTTNAEQSMDVLTRALDQTEGVLSAIPADRLSDATPCTDWDVASLVAHVVADPRNFVMMSSGEQPDWSVMPLLPDDWTAEFRSAADDLMRMWRDAGESASPEAIDWQTAEFAVHTWDLVRAVGLPRDMDPEVAQRGLDFMSAAMTPDNRGAAFGPAVPIGEDAPVYDRLAAFAGRNPQ